MPESGMVINSLLNQVERVPIGSLKPHPQNDNVGDIDQVATSLRENGMYKPIVVQRKNMYICAGNHTWLGARRLGWTHIDAVILDISDQQAKRIMLVDNHSRDSATYDDQVTKTVLRELQELGDNMLGLGFDTGELDDLLAQANSDAGATLDDVMGALEEQDTAEAKLREQETFDGAPLGDEPDDELAPSSPVEVREREAAVDDPKQDFEGASDQMKGAFDLKADMVFDGVGPWEIPRIRTDMVPTYADIPNNLDSWAGSATKNWPVEDQWWLYNYGVDSTSGMKDISKVIVSFFCYDEYFERWWDYPDRYVKKVINSGIKTILSPDFSMHTVGADSRTISLWNLYRQRWMARYFQEAGLKVIPNITWSMADDAFLQKHVLATLPKGLDMIAMQIQAMLSGDKDNEKEEIDRLSKQVQSIFDTLQPKGALIYYGKQGRDFFEKHVNPGCPVRMVESRLTKLGEQASRREKKTTI
jgi:ParB-like chromosome segregation protein Spo0J